MKCNVLYYPLHIHTLDIQIRPQGIPDIQYAQGHCILDIQQGRIEEEGQDEDTEEHDDDDGDDEKLLEEEPQQHAAGVSERDFSDTIVCSSFFKRYFGNRNFINLHLIFTERIQISNNNFVSFFYKVRFCEQTI